MSKKDIISKNGSVQINVAKDNATLVATQNNEITPRDLEEIIHSIEINSGELPKKNREELLDIVELVRTEFSKDTPNQSRLRNCVTLLAPMLAIVNGIPTLVQKVNQLIDFITLHI